MLPALVTIGTCRRRGRGRGPRDDHGHGGSGRSEAERVRVRDADGNVLWLASAPLFAAGDATFVFTPPKPT